MWAFFKCSPRHAFWNHPQYLQVRSFGKYWLCVVRVHDLVLLLEQDTFVRRFPCRDVLLTKSKRLLTWNRDEMYSLKWYVIVFWHASQEILREKSVPEYGFNCKSLNSIECTALIVVIIELAMRWSSEIESPKSFSRVERYIANSVAGMWCDWWSEGTFALYPLSIPAPSVKLLYFNVSLFVQILYKPNNTNGKVYAHSSIFRVRKFILDKMISGRIPAEEEFGAIPKCAWDMHYVVWEHTDIEFNACMFH